MMVILRMLRTADNLLDLWKPSSGMTRILDKYYQQPCLETAVQYYVEGVVACVLSKHITFGTMCSGTDFISEVFNCVCHAFTTRFGTDCKLSLQQLFAVEKNRDLQNWCALQARELGFQPKMYADMNSLPLQDMQRCDVLFAGTSCKSLSKLNSKRRSLADIDPSDPLCSSGNTMNGLLKYVELHHPTFVVMENVSAILQRTTNSCSNSEWLREQFHRLGYTLHLARVSSHRYLLPQRRNRVWMLAELNGPAECGWSDLFDLMVTGPCPVDDFLK